MELWEKDHRRIPCIKHTAKSIKKRIEKEGKQKNLNGQGRVEININQRYSCMQEALGSSFSTSNTYVEGSLILEFQELKGFFAA